MNRHLKHEPLRLTASITTTEQRYGKMKIMTITLTGEERKNGLETRFEINLRKSAGCQVPRGKQIQPCIWIIVSTSRNFWYSCGEAVDIGPSLHGSPCCNKLFDNIILITFRDYSSNPWPMMPRSEGASPAVLQVSGS